MTMKFIVNDAVFTEKEKGNQFFTMDIHNSNNNGKILKTEGGREPIMGENVSNRI